MHLTAQEKLHSNFIISGKIKSDAELNNIHYLAGILPPTVTPDTNTIKFKATTSRIDKAQVTKSQ